MEKEINELMKFLNESFNDKSLVWRDFYNKSQNMITFYKIPIENIIKKIFSKVKMDINVE